jgi:GT2 family glycosyltransferase/2-polyprenyl-3-methyl-5-hydroxy-6-metoxy-1,4-benzoquinol methylase
MTNALRYDRTVRLDGHDSLSEIARLVGTDQVVLDLGASTGALGAYLRDQKSCTVDGVEFDPAAAGVARLQYRNLLELDLQSARLADHFPKGAYDTIVCADVLEHLSAPEKLLAQLQPLLSASGRLLISIPNVGYAGIIAGLLKGEFRYTETGLLDSTHLRFFTRSSLLELLARHGFHARTIRPLVADLADSEFRDHRLDALSPAVLRALLAQPDALTYQFIVEALPGEGIAEASIPVAAQPRFGLQLYWALDGAVDEAHSSRAAALLGNANQRVELPIPALPSAPSALRLDVADRPGYLRLRSIALRTRQGEPLWSWDGDPGSLRARQQLTVLGDLWLSTGDDPSIDLPAPPEALARLREGGQLSIELDWPMSPDHQFTRELLDERESRWQAERALLLRRFEELHSSALRQAETAAAVETRVETARAALQQRVDSALRGEESRRASAIDSLQAQVVEVRATHHGVAHQLQSIAHRVSLIEAAPGVRKAARTVRSNLLRQQFLFRPVRGHNVKALADGEWEALTSDPFFELDSTRGRFPAGWVQVDVELDAEAAFVNPPRLYVDGGEGYTETSCLLLPRPRDGQLSTLLKLPPLVRGIRFDPIDHPGRFRLGVLSVQEMGKAEAGARLAVPVLKEIISEPGRTRLALGKAMDALKTSGFAGLKRSLRERTRIAEPTYQEWVAQFDTLRAHDLGAIRDSVSRLASRPLISVVMPVYETPEIWLRRAIESVREQAYEHWELCIADDCSKAPHVRQVLEEAAASDARIKVLYREKNGHISEASNSALSLATGAFVALLDHDDELPPQALYMVAEAIARDPAIDLLYSDEDKIDVQGRRYEPYFKPDWDADLFASQNFFSHLGVYRTSLVREVGGFRKGLEGSQDYDLALRCSRRSNRICHVPHVLYHWRSVDGSTATTTSAKSYAQTAAERALKEHFAEEDPAIEVSSGAFPTTYRVRRPLPSPPPLVSILIPTRDGYSILRRCLDSIAAKTSYPAYEIIVMDNQSKAPETLDYLASLQTSGRARVLPWDRPFNYSAINNAAAREARGDVLCLLNNDVEIITPDWLEELVSQAIRPGVGAVGAKLLYPNGTVQHAGVVTGLYGVAGHIHRYLPREAAGYFCRAQMVQRMTVVTGACLAVRRDLYEQVGGLDEANLAVAFNDVDFCLRLAERGETNIWTPYAELYHHESYSRGAEDTPAKKARFVGEIHYMQKRWHGVLENDPAYNPNLSLNSENFALAWPPRAHKPWMG